MTPSSRRAKATVAAALALCATAPAAASAKLPPPDPPPSNHPVVVVQTSPRSGFDWGDAGIGAAGGVGLAMLAAGGLVVVQRRGRLTHASVSPKR
jgi:hypothetical protein